MSIVDIEVLTDKSCIDPKVKIFTREHTGLVDNIIMAIENASENEFPPIPAISEDRIKLISQRDIMRMYIQARKLIVQTESGSYIARKTLSALEEDLDPSRFVRISQSEIINIHKVNKFDISIAGTIGVEFEDGTKSWASRSCVKAIKNLLKS